MRFACNPGATTHELDDFQQSTGITLPNDYREFLSRCNGGEGFVGDDYLILWKVGDLVEFNRDYEVDKYLPDALLFGSSGGGEAYGFLNNGENWIVMRVPFIGMDPKHVIWLANSFSEFLELPKKT